MNNCHFRTTVGADRGKRLQFWNDTLRDSIFELNFKAREPVFHAELIQHCVGPLRFSRLAISTGHSVSRSTQAIARSSISRFNLNYVLQGALTAEQHGRCCTVAAEELVLLDSREPYSVETVQRTRHISVHIPVEWLKHWLPDPEDCVARPIRRGMPWNATLAASLKDGYSIASAPQGLSGLCADQLGGAIALVFGPNRSRNTTHCRRWYRRIRDTLGKV